MSSPSPLAGLAAVTSAPGTPVPLDDTDRALLRLLAADARASQRSLARELGLSAPTVGERIARMERLGVIRGYRVVVDPGAVGCPVLVYLAITAAQGYDLGPLMAAVAALPEVEDVTLVTGDLDLLARCRVRDHEHLRGLLMQHVWQVPGVQRTTTYLSIADGPAKNGVTELLEASCAPRTRR